ncbi:unnamed protein product [Ilex paraguariensis]|uniref:Uncharacterized protein n=1 Tax=Ilex paraguariensis TaxID=185542 RepID=A0ABC8SAR5_9AQUA
MVDENLDRLFVLPLYYPREFLVDLIGRPGELCRPDSLLNGTTSVLVASPLCHPKFKSAEAGENFRMLAKLYFADGQSLNITFDDASSGIATDQDNSAHLQFHNPYKMNQIDRNNFDPVSSSICESSTSALPQRAAWPIKDFQGQNSYKPFPNGISSTHLGKGSAPNQILPTPHRPSFVEANQLASCKSSHELSLIEEDFDIQWSDLELKEKIGEGFCYCFKNILKCE